MGLEREIVSIRAIIGGSIAPCQTSIRHKSNIPKPKLDHKYFHTKYACTAERRNATTAVSASSQPQDLSSPSVDDSDSIQSYTWEEPSIDGQLIIAALQANEVGAASVVLTRAFATSPQGVPIEDGRKYCEKMLTMSPKGVFLVGRLHPLAAATSNSRDTSTAPEEQSPAWLPEGQISRLIATASISFHPDSRETFQSLQPPDSDAYLCNIAVDPKFRRQGIARKMLAACEALAAKQGYKRFYLHVRLGDTAARSLYETSGYAVVEEESFLVKLTGRTPVCLMVKEFS